MGSDAKAQAEVQATARLLHLPEFVGARTVLAYHALPDELSTTQLLAAAHGKQLFLPRVNGDNLEIVAYNPATLCRGAYGIQDERIVEKYKVSYTNVVGLPKEKLAKALLQAGVENGNDRAFNRFGK